MTTVHYPVSTNYRNVPGLGLQPAVEVELIYGRQRARAVGILDSGSAWTVFSKEHAALLGIADVTAGRAGTAQSIKACVMGVVISLIAIPWPYFWSAYERAPTDRWKSA